MLDFAPLSFNAPFAPKPLRPPPAVFSLVPRGRAKSFRESNSVSMSPPELFEATLGMPMAELWHKRPFLAAKGQPHFDGQNFVEWLGKRNGSEYLFHEASFVARGGELRRVELLGDGWTTNVSAARIESMFDWFFETLGPPDRALDFTKKDGRPGYGAIYCCWTNSSTTLALGAQVTGKTYSTRPFISLNLKVHRPERREFDESKAVLLRTDVPTLRRELRDLLRRIAELPNGP